MRVFSVRQTLGVKWKGSRNPGGFIALWALQPLYEAEAGSFCMQVATGSSSVATQACCLERRPGGPRGIIEGNHAKVEMRKTWGINAKACVARASPEKECQLSRNPVTRPGSEQASS